MIFLLQSASVSSCIVLLGNFDVPTILWSEDYCVPTIVKGIIEDNVCNLVDDNFLQQFIKGPSHIASNKFDLLLCNEPEVIHVIS